MALECDLHDAAVHRGGFVILLDVFARHHVDDQFGALAPGRLLGLGDEILRVVIDRYVRAERACDASEILPDAGALRAKLLEIPGDGGIRITVEL